MYSLTLVLPRDELIINSFALHLVTFLLYTKILIVGLIWNNFDNFSKCQQKSFQPSLVEQRIYWFTWKRRSMPEVCVCVCAQHVCACMCNRTYAVRTSCVGVVYIQTLYVDDNKLSILLFLGQRNGIGLWFWIAFPSFLRSWTK